MVCVSSTDPARSVMASTQKGAHLGCLWNPFNGRERAVYGIAVAVNDDRDLTLRQRLNDELHQRCRQRSSTWTSRSDYERRQEIGNLRATTSQSQHTRVRHLPTKQSGQHCQYRGVPGSSPRHHRGQHGHHSQFVTATDHPWAGRQQRTRPVRELPATGSTSSRCR